MPSSASRSVGEVLGGAQERTAGDLDAVAQADAAQLALFRRLRPALLERVELGQRGRPRRMLPSNSPQS